MRQKQFSNANNKMWCVCGGGLGALVGIVMGNGGLVLHKKTTCCSFKSILNFVGMQCKLFQCKLKTESMI